jgi:hypothetical protein
MRRDGATSKLKTKLQQLPRGLLSAGKTPLLQLRGQTTESLYDEEEATGSASH